MAHAAVPVCAILSNSVAYLLLLVGARRLDHDHYSELVALLAVLLVGTVPSLALQTVAARRSATSDPDARGDSDIAAASWAISIGAGAVVAVLAVPLAHFLHLGSTLPLLVLAIGLVPTTLFGSLIGVAQGHQQFARVAVLTTIQGLGRSLGGLTALLLVSTPLSATIGVAVGTSLCCAIATLISPVRLFGTSTSSVADVWRETLHAGHGHGAFLLLVNLDILLVRHVSTADAAAIYAAGSVVSRGALWLPQSVGVLVFARLTAHSGHYRLVRIAVAVIAALGVVGVVLTASLGHLVVTIVGGGYEDLAAHGWLFAVIGASFALVQFCMLAGLAIRRPGRIAVLWVTMAAELMVVLPQHHPTSATVAAAVAVISVAAAAAMIVLAGRNWSASGIGPTPLRVGKDRASSDTSE